VCAGYFALKYLTLFRTVQNHWEDIAVCAGYFALKYLTLFRTVQKPLGGYSCLCRILCIEIFNPIAFKFLTLLELYGNHWEDIAACAGYFALKYLTLFRIERKQLGGYSCMCRILCIEIFNPI
jgi:hypothetical protein